VGMRNALALAYGLSRESVVDIVIKSVERRNDGV
jgi:hypothetical protein